MDILSKSNSEILAAVRIIARYNLGSVAQAMAHPRYPDALTVIEGIAAFPAFVGSVAAMTGASHACDCADAWQQVYASIRLSPDIVALYARHAAEITALVAP